MLKPPGEQHERHARPPREPRCDLEELPKFHGWTQFSKVNQGQARV